MKYRHIFLYILGPALALALSATSSAAGKAMIVTQNAKPAECISRVAIRKIDGREKFVSPQGFQLEPGVHQLSGTVALNTANCPGVRGNSYTDIPPLEAEFEAGKTYYIGFDHSSTDRNDWKFVIWKVQ